MRFTRKLAVLSAVVAFSLPAFAAPLEEGWSPSAQQQSADDQSLPVLPVSRAPREGPLADADGNGLSDGLEALMAAETPDARFDVVVTFSGAGNAAAAQRAVGAFDLRHEFTLIKGFAATMTAAQARALSAAPGVFRVERDFTLYANLEAARRDFGVERLAVETATAGLTGAGVEICVVDTGVHGTHEQFVDEATGASKVVGFIDLIGDIDGVIRTAAYDDQGHGSHVSGIAAGDGTGLSLAAPLRGVAPGATLHVAKVLDFTGTGADSIVIQGIEWCVGQGVDVINLSLGNTGSSDGLDSLSQAVDSAVASGVIVVVAAGNSGATPASISTPAAARRAITVGAVAEWSGSPSLAWFSAGMYPAPFSSRGPTRDGRIKPDIMAPGVTIASAYADPFGLFGCGDGCYNVLSGTSMASPFVAGTVALMLEAAGAPLSADQALQILASTAHERGTAAGKDNEWGFGLLDAYAAVAVAQGQLAVTPTVFPSYEFGHDSVPNNGATRIPIEVTTAGMPLAVTITLDGSLGSFGWKPDLDVVLLDANGEPFLVANPLYPWLSSEPFIPASGTASTCPAGEECGLVGRQETVHLNAPAGSYFVEVYAFDGFPNNGAGGSFSYEISNGTANAAAPDPVLAADAGADQNMTDSDGDGVEAVMLDGSASTGAIVSYVWSVGGVTVAEGKVASATLAVGSHTVTLAVSDGAVTSTDSLVVTVEAAGGNTKSKPCPPNKPGCA